MSYGTSNSYREMEILAMPPAKRVVMLYSALLVSLRQARGHIERGEIELRTEKLWKAEEIVHELAVSLDREAGGELATKLAAIYAWLLGEFAGLQTAPSVQKLDTTIRIVADLHSAWEGAAQQLASATTEPPR